MPFKKLFIAFFVLILLPLYNAHALSTIRDEEIETVLKDLAKPIFEAADLNPDDIQLVIINSPDINAFVAGGMNIFINTGLLTLSETPETVLGVFAHETGHIASGHLARQGEEFKKASVQTAVGYILGIATLLSGAPDAGQAILLGSGHLANRNILAYSRKQEESADQFALGVLDKNSYSSVGLLTLLEHLNKEQSLQIDNPNPYTLTHPLSRERIQHIRIHMEGSKIAYKSIPTALEKRYEHAMVKLQAYLDPPQKTLLRFPEEDNSTVARLARTIAYYKEPDFKKASYGIDNLIKSFPNNPFYHELKGQVLLENGHVKESIPSYEKALHLLPKSTLLRLQLAMAQIALDTPELLVSATKHLEKVVQKEPRNALAWRQLAIAYGRQDNLGMSYLALAEEAALLHMKKDVKHFVELALKHLPKDSPAALRVKDIEAVSSKDK